MIKTDSFLKNGVKLSQEKYMEKIEIVKCRPSKHGVEYALSTIDSYFCLNGSGESGGASSGERALSYSFLMDTLRKVMGGTLTIIDASIHDEKQNKAIKDLIRKVISDEMNFASEWAFDQEKLQKTLDESIANMSDEELDKLEPITIEKALGVE